MMQFILCTTRLVLKQYIFSSRQLCVKAGLVITLLNVMRVY